MSDKPEKKSSLAEKFLKFAGKAIILGTLSFTFGIAVGGLIDYHLWHEMAEAQAVIKQTSWIQDWLSADTFFGGSIIDGIAAIGDFLEGDPEIIPADEARKKLAMAVPEGPSTGF